MTDLESSLRCPVCHAGRLHLSSSTARCENCGQEYPARGGIPALIPPTSPLYVDVRQAATRPTMAFSTDAARQRDYWESDDVHRAVDHPIVEGFSRQRWQHLAGLLPLGELQNALDVGAGSGFSTAYAPAHLEVTATDGSWGMIEKNPRIGRTGRLFNGRRRRTVRELSLLFSPRVR
jgi:uncharacterized protein YbaR (Trm112 family)